MGYGRITKLVHVLRKSSIVHQRVIHESYSPNKRAIEFERLGLIEIIKEFKEKNTSKYISYPRLCLII